MIKKSTQTGYLEIQIIYWKIYHNVVFYHENRYFKNSTAFKNICIFIFFFDSINTRNNVLTLYGGGEALHDIFSSPNKSTELLTSALKTLKKYSLKGFCWKPMLGVWTTLYYLTTRPTASCNFCSTDVVKIVNKNLYCIHRKSKYRVSKTC